MLVYHRVHEDPLQYQEFTMKNSLDFTIKAEDLTTKQLGHFTNRRWDLSKVFGFLRIPGGTRNIHLPAIFFIYNTWLLTQFFSVKSPFAVVDGNRWVREGASGELGPDQCPVLWQATSMVP